MYRRYLGRAIGIVGLVMALPARGESQAACTAGPLSAYLNDAGIGCTIGGLVVNQFAGGLTADADDITLNPFLLQGPPGFVWLGFSVLFGDQVTVAADRPFGFSFWTAGHPIFGLMAQQQLGPNANAFSALHTRVTGDGGSIRANDRYRLVNGSLVADPRACGPGSSCLPGSATWFGGPLLDCDRNYRVNISPVLGVAGSPNDYSVAVLVQTSSVTPEPATLLLVATGLGAAGAAVRRRKK
jgi:hypothetical protein